jgi:serine/threonine protein kinase
MRPDGSYAPALLGKQLCGKWGLVRILGSGGMSTVFEGLHRNGKRVAIKVLHPELAASPRLRDRFKREAYVANRVSHLDAVSVIDDDTSEDGLVFLVMEYLDGETLGGRLRRTGPLAADQVIVAAFAVLDVLAVAHKSGVVHRDVKPDNIFVTRHEARIKLLDFGIASVRELSARSADSTGAGATIGTPAFMAPEQARGRLDEVNATTDLWSLGATMFTVLTGRFVHSGANSTELLIAAATHKAPSVGSIVEGLPKGLAGIIDRALAFERSERWLDAAAMRSALVALGPRRAIDVFPDDGFVPLGSDQSTQDESKAPSGMVSRFIGARTPRSGFTSSRARVRLYGMVTGTTLAMATSASLLWPARPSPVSGTQPPERHLNIAPIVAVKERAPPSDPLETATASPLVTASSRPTAPPGSSTPALPSARSTGPTRRTGLPRAAASAPIEQPSKEGLTQAAGSSPHADPLDRR